MSAQLFGRRVRTPAGGHEVLVQSFDGADKRVVSLDGKTLGWLRRKPRGSRKVWSFAVAYQDDFQGRYVDMAHAVQGLLAKATTQSEEG